MDRLNSAVRRRREVAFEIKVDDITLRAVLRVLAAQEQQQTVYCKGESFALHAGAVVIDQMRIIKRSQHLFTYRLVNLSVLNVRRVNDPQVSALHQWENKRLFAFPFSLFQSATAPRCSAE